MAPPNSVFSPSRGFDSPGCHQLMTPPTNRTPVNQAKYYPLDLDIKPVYRWHGNVLMLERPGADLDPIDTDEIACDW